MGTDAARYAICREPDFFIEASALMDGFFNRQEPEGGLPWERQPLLRYTKMTTLSDDKGGDAFQDMTAFVHRCRAEARALLAHEEELAGLSALRSEDPKGERMPQRFLLQALHTLSTLPDRRALVAFRQACLYQLHHMEGKLFTMDDGPYTLEGQARIERLLGPEFTMADILSTVSESPFKDADKLVLLRFFQQIEAWHARVMGALTKLEQVCQSHFPLVARRFEQKVQALGRPGGLDTVINWLDRLGDVSLRTDEPIHVRLHVLSYNGLLFHLSTWRRTRMEAHLGILFEEMSAMEDKRKAREKLTQEQLKAIADPTRLSILRLLSAKPWYVQQLADELKLSSATLSHHLGVLTQALMLRQAVAGRRSYYRLNRQELRALATDLSHMADHSEEEP